MTRYRGYIQLWAFLLRRRWPRALSLLALGITGVALLSSRPFEYSGILGLFSLAIGVTLFANDTRLLRRETEAMHKANLEPGSVSSLRKSDLYGSYETLTIGAERLLVSDRVNHLIREVPLALAVEARRFRLPDSADRVAPYVMREHFRSGAVLFNDRKVRLGTDLTDRTFEEDGPVMVAPTDYFSGLCTNELALSEIRLRGHENPLLSGTSLCATNGTLDDLAGSRCSNHIGVSTLAFTEDGCLIMPIQARGSAQSPNFATASGSGSADWSDLEGCEQLGDLITKAATRELREEIGLVGGRETAIDSQVLGYARLLTRGGKPEFYCLSYVATTADRLDVSRRERDFIADLVPFRIDRTDLDSIVRSLDQFEYEHSSRFASALSISLCLLRRQMAAEPDRVWAFVNGRSVDRASTLKV